VGRNVTRAVQVAESAERAQRGGLWRLQGVRESLHRRVVLPRDEPPGQCLHHQEPAVEPVDETPAADRGD
jgi:hypothetical protein